MPKNYWDQPFDDIEDTRFLEIEDQMVLTYNELSLQKKKHPLFFRMEEPVLQSSAYQWKHRSARRPSRSCHR